LALLADIISVVVFCTVGLAFESASRAAKMYKRAGFS
jgi:hypothetical protein